MCSSQTGGELSEKALEAVDEVLASNMAGTTTFSAHDIINGAKSKIAMFRGDICTLKVDGIVNAANQAGLGCFVPHHVCIDNIIHRRAGPRLRKDCAVKMKRRKRPLYAGTTPIVTDAYALPCKKVVHVTGPQVHRGSVPTALQREQLKQCYQKTLDACRENSIRSIAFPCISTGLFGFPQDDACKIAVAAVREWLSASEAHSGALDAVIFDVFTDRDERLYASALADGATCPIPPQIATAAKFISDADAVPGLWPVQVYR